MAKRAVRSKDEGSAGDSCPVDFINTGSTMLNLAASQKAIDGGWARGRIDNIVGDGSSGKTLLALETAAHCFYNMLGNKSHNFPQVKKVSIIYNNVEGVMDFPVDMMYGNKFNDGVEWIRTGTIQEFGRDFFKRVKTVGDGHFMLYIIDSWDALDSEEELKAFMETVEKDKDPEGSYDLGKQKYGSKRFFKTLCSKIEGDNGQVKKDCTLIIVSQTRQKIGVTFGEKKYRAGGDALNFYTHQVCWLAETSKVPKTKEGIKLITGINVKARFKRNKTAKPFREAEFPIVFDYGVDDIASMIHYLYGPKDKIINDLFEKNFKHYATAIEYIDSNGLNGELIKLVEEKWNRIEDGVKSNRVKRFPE